MHHASKLLIFFSFIFLIIPFQTHAKLNEKLSGQILLQVEAKGEAWYIYPKNKSRYFLGRPDDAFQIMRKLGLGITNNDLNKIPKDTDSDTDSNQNLRQKLSGQILLQVESKGEAWYIYPKNLKRYYLGRPADAFEIMRKLGLGITNNDLNQISLPPISINENYSNYEYKTIDTKNGTFDISMITINRKYPNLKIQSNTADSYNCEKDCNAISLTDHINQYKGFAGIHGAYFCPPDYSGCKDEINFYFWPFYNSQTGFFANEERLKWTEGPVIIFDDNNTPYFFEKTNDIYSPENFKTRYNKNIRAAISNGPILIQDKKNVVNSQSMDTKQKELKSYRGGFGYDKENFYLIIAKKANVPDLASIFESLNVDTAINLDGGGSSAMVYGNEYKVGPGRLLPTAIIFTDQ